MRSAIWCMRTDMACARAENCSFGVLPLVAAAGTLCLWAGSDGAHLSAPCEQAARALAEGDLCGQRRAVRAYDAMWACGAPPDVLLGPEVLALCTARVSSQAKLAP